MLNIRSFIDPEVQMRILSYKDKFIAETALAQQTLTGHQTIKSEPQDSPELAKIYLKAKLEALKEREKKFIENPAELMEHLCLNHDWTFNFSEDHSQWEAGNRTHRFMEMIVREIGRPARDIWNKYAPGEIFRCHI
jgi:hypothetical protein